MNDDFKLKKTRMIVVASIFWLAISFYFADTGYLYDYFDFEDVNWGEGSMFMKVDIDFDNEGGQPPISFGESQLLSVPFALYSNSSGDHHWVINDGAMEPVDESTSINLNVENNSFSDNDIVQQVQTNQPFSWQIMVEDFYL